MDEPLVSIIVPVYNTSSYLPKCIYSLINQTYSNIEIILVNDGSTDNSLEVLKEFARKDKRIKVLNQENKGVSAARNLGIENATGIYIMFVDSDDRIDFEMCQQMINIAVDRKVDIVLSSYLRHYKNNIIKPRYILPKEKYYSKNECDELRRRLFGLVDYELIDPSQADSLGTSFAKLFKTDIIIYNKLYFIDLKLIGSAEDVLFNIEYFKYVNSAYYINKCFYHYRKEDNKSITSTYRPDLYNQWQVLFGKFNKIIEDENLNKNFALALNNRITLSIIGLGLNILASEKTGKEKRKELNEILATQEYRSACDNLSLSFFPIHWKLFFYFVKKRFVVGIYFILKGINYYVNRNK